MAKTFQLCVLCVLEGLGVRERFKGSCLLQRTQSKNSTYKTENQY